MAFQFTSSSPDALPHDQLVQGAPLGAITPSLSNGLSSADGVRPGNAPVAASPNLDRFDDAVHAWMTNPGITKDTPSRWMNHDSVLSGQATLQGTGKRDRLMGTNKQDILNGRGGNDVLIGKGQGDRLVGGNGKDRLNGNSGKDTLLGGKGSDRLKGGGGDDELNGGQGKDTYIGGSGKDTIVLRLGDGSTDLQKADIVKRFQIGQDSIDLAGINGGAIAIFQGEGDRANDTIIQHRDTGEYLLVVRNVAANAFTPDIVADNPVNFPSEDPIITEPAIDVMPGTAASFVNSGVSFSNVNLSQEAQVQNLGGSSITVGPRTYYIGYEQVGKTNQNPILVSYDSQNPAGNWVKRNYEVTGADSRGYGLFWSGTNLYGTFSIDGTQGDASEDFRRVSGDAVQSWLRGYGSGGGAKISIIARIDPNTGDLLDAAYLSARLNDGNSNSLVIDNVSVNTSGNLVIQARSWFSPRNPDGSPMTQTGSGSSPFDYTVEITPDLTQVISTAANGWT